MVQAEQATTPKGMWLLIVAAPVIVAIQMQINFVLVSLACTAHRRVALYVVTAVALLLTIATGWIAVSVWRRVGTEWPAERDDLADRVRFISVLGMLSSGMSFLVILAQGIATIQFDPCQL
jgi:ribose/xylose/arabinose/galactoside ABC-type transport system permease subunit